jgi:hypothetical protein
MTPIMGLRIPAGCEADHLNRTGFRTWRNAMFPARRPLAFRSALNAACHRHGYPADWLNCEVVTSRTSPCPGDSVEVSLGTSGPAPSRALLAGLPTLSASVMRESKQRAVAQGQSNHSPNSPRMPQDHTSVKREVAVRSPAAPTIWQPSIHPTVEWWFP